MPAKKYHTGLLVPVYEAIRDGCTHEQTATAVGVDKNTFYTWTQKHPELAAAIERGKKARQSSNTLKDYIYGRLPEKLKRIWDRINALEDVPYSSELVERIFAKHGKEVRQHLFLHALIHSHFSVTHAASMVGVGPKLVAEWKLMDPDFAELMGQILVWKKDYAESCLYKLLQQGDPAVTIFVNRTLNRDRGYNEKVELEIKGNINHSIDFDRLSVETKRQILEELRQQQNGNDIEGEVPRLLSTEENAA